MAAFAKVELLETTFEACPAREAAFRLVIAAQAWHWISPELRFAKAAQVLSPGGSLAVFGNVPVELPAALLEDFRQIYLRRTGAWELPPEAWYLPGRPIKAEFERAGRFAPVTHKTYPWKWRHTTSSCSDFMITRSDYRMLPQATREAVLAEIAQSIDRHCGTFDMDYETHLYIAPPLGSVTLRRFVRLSFSNHLKTKGVVDESTFREKRVRRVRHHQPPGTTECL